MQYIKGCNKYGVCFILGISTGNSSKRWKITGSLEEVLDVAKKHEIEETFRFGTYSSTEDFGLTG